MKPSHTFLAYARAGFCSTGTLKPLSTCGMDEYSGDVLGTSVFSIVHGCSYFSGVTGLTVCPRYREVLYSLECIIKSFTVYNSYTFWNVQLCEYPHFGRAMYPNYVVGCA